MPFLGFCAWYVAPRFFLGSLWYSGPVLFPGFVMTLHFSTPQAPEILCWRSRAFLRQGKMVRSRFELEYELALVDAVGAEHSVDGV